MTARRMLSVVAGISLVYDLATGLALLLATDRIGALFGVPLPSPIIFVKLNGLFLTAVGIGYALPLFDPVRYRAYLWVFGPLLKGAGAVLFIVDYFVNASPAAFLLFALTDGTLAVVTLAALLRRDPQPLLPPDQYRKTK